MRKSQFKITKGVFFISGDRCNTYQKGTSARADFLKIRQDKNDDELVKKVYLAQKTRPVKGDFVQLVEKDL